MRSSAESQLIATAQIGIGAKVAALLGTTAGLMALALLMTGLVPG